MESREIAEDLYKKGYRWGDASLHEDQTMQQYGYTEDDTWDIEWHLININIRETGKAPEESVKIFYIQI